jgi:short-subunit dehydrogenase
MTPVAIITGASAGIGTELARVFAKHGHALVLVARREARLKMLAAELEARGATPPLVLPVDLAERDAVARIAAALTANNLEPEYVVNNAGYGLAGHAAERDRDELLTMIDVNMRALTELSLAFVDSLIRRRGGILNIASVAGFLPGPGSAVYYASKAYVLSFSESLHRELRPNMVRVCALCPGPVATEFQARAGVTWSKTPFLDLPAARVAEAGYRGLMRGKRLVIPGFGNKTMAFLPRITPRDLLLSLVDRRQRARTVSPASRT